jgi:hypothetical protein
LRKLLIGAAAAAVTLGVAAGALAQTAAEGTLTVSATPADAGTAKKPKNTRLSFSTEVATPNSTADKIIIKLPPQLKFSGKGFARCSFAALTDAPDPSTCPAGSKAGPKGISHALVGPASSPVKAPLDLDVYPYVDGAKAFNFLLMQQGGGVQRPIRGKITNEGHTLTISIPFDLRQPGGLDASLVAISQTFSAKRNGHYIVSSTGCKNKKWKVKAQITFTARADGTPVPAPFNASQKVSCKK